MGSCLKIDNGYYQRYHLKNYIFFHNYFLSD